ncbi:D-isomer specific 2-hydroxyacid dehydrogenase family protein [Corynebacterium confusum]
MKYFMGPYVWEETVADIDAAGHERVDRLEDAEAYINTSPNPAKIPDMPGNIGFIQHCFTGVEGLIEAGLISEGGLRWANSAGAFATPVAESALGLLLSQAHQHKAFALAADWSVAGQLDKQQAWLYSSAGREPKTVVVLGAGGIGKRLIGLLAPFGLHVIAVNNSGREVAGANETFALKEAGEVWGRADFVVNILPLTQETNGLIDASFFARLKPSAIFVNVGRGATVVTDDLVQALQDGTIAGAGLEVVDPEPLPDGHPLYALPNCTMTPHIAASQRVARFHMGPVFDANARAFAAGERMPTEVNPEAGY